jgi:hypothetical protein
MTGSPCGLSHPATSARCLLSAMSHLRLCIALRVRSPPGMAREDARERPPGGEWRDVVSPQRLPQHLRPDAARRSWRDAVASVAAGPCERCRRVGRRAPGTPSTRLTPGGLAGLRALLPLREPAVGTAHLPAERLHGLPSQGALASVWTAPGEGSERRWQRTALRWPCWMMLGARCHGTLLDAWG